jgi:inosose dehydratase
MSIHLSRRTFLKQLGISAAVTSLPASTFASFLSADVPPGMKIGYAAITWGGNDVQAIKDIASLGFKGIQLRSNTVEAYEQKTEELRQLLKAHKLMAPVFSSGNVNVNAAEKQALIDKHVKHAKFLKAIGGGPYLQLTNNARPKDRQPTAQELKDLGMVMTEVGKRTADMGITVVYHNHMHQLGETPEEIEQIMAAADPKYVKMLLDIAHYYQGGGDPAKAVKQYKDRIHVLHLKDVQSMASDNDNTKSYKFVELGQGKVDMPGVINALNDIKYKGWGIIELDSVPDKSRTPLQSAQISKDYLQNKIGFKI